MNNETKHMMYICLVSGFLIGLLVTAMAISSCQTDYWYKKVMTHEKTRVIMADSSGASIWELSQDSVRRNWDEP
jgi:hypothetical protein